MQHLVVLQYNCSNVATQNNAKGNEMKKANKMKSFITNQVYDMVHLDCGVAQEEGDEKEIENAKKALKILRKLWTLNKVTKKDAVWFKNRFTY